MSPILQFLNSWLARVAFEGGPDRLRFVSRFGLIEGPDDLPRWVDLHWTDDSLKNKGDLIVEERRILPPDNLPDPNVYWRDVVFQGQSCVFSFLAQTQTNEPALWTNEWHYPKQGTLPRAVRMQCLSEGKSGQLVIPLDYAVSSTIGLTLR